MFEQETRPSAIQMVSDDAISGPEADLLDFGVFAHSIAGLIDHPATTTPLTLAINGRWGMGKSSLAKLVDHLLANKLERPDERPHVTYWFNAWMHDEADKLAAAFIAYIARFCHQRQNIFLRLLRPLPAALADAESRSRRRAAWALIAFVGAAWFAFVALTGSDGNMAAFVKKTFGLQFDAASATASGLVVFVLVAAAVLSKFLATMKSVGAFIAQPSLEANIGSLRRVREQLQKMIRDVTPEGSKFVVFIDDLERCRDTRAIDVLEVVNQLLSVEPVITVIIADIPAVATCAEIKYVKLAERYDPSAGARTTPDAGQLAYGRLFLQKFIQLQFDLPPRADKKMSTFANAVVEQAERAATDPEETPSWARRYWDALSGAMSSLFLAAWRPGAAGKGAKPDWLQRRGFGFQVFFYYFFWPLVVTRWAQLHGLRLTRVTQLNWTGFWGWMMKAWVVFFGFMGQVYWAMNFLWLPYLKAELGSTPILAVAAEIGISPQFQFMLLTSILAVMTQIYLGVFVWGFAHLQQIRMRRAAAAEVRQLDNLAQEGGGIEDLVAEAKDEDKERIEALWHERRQRHLGSDSEDFRIARETAFNLIAPPPRNAKRLLNRLRLHLFLFVESDVLGAGKPVTAEHVGKWAALQEVWPELTGAVRARPEIMADLETTTAAKFESALRTLVPAFDMPAGANGDAAPKAKSPAADKPTSAWHKLWTVLQSGPALAGVVGVMTRYDPEGTSDA